MWVIIISLAASFGFVGLGFLFMWLVCRYISKQYKDLEELTHIDDDE